MRLANEDSASWSAPQSWASALGFAYVPLYGRPERNAGDESGVLLDGKESSFQIFTASRSEDLLADDRLQESWSSNLTHSLGIDVVHDSVVLRRWDQPSALRKFAIPGSAKGAEELVRIIGRAPAPTTGDVVLHLLRAFRAVRNLLPDDDAVRALSRFNLLLTAAEALERRAIDRSAVEEDITFVQLERLLTRLDVAPSLLRQIRWQESNATDPIPAPILDYFFSPEPY